MAFYVGQKVVCVDDQNWLNPHLVKNFTHPIAGNIYRIRGFTKGGNVLLAEIVNQDWYWAWGRGEGGFLPRRFRPVVERKTDISALTALLNPSNHKHLEGV